MSKVITPKLSTVDQPSFEMGVKSFDLLLEEMNARKEQKPFYPKTIELGTSIIERGLQNNLKNIDYEKVFYPIIASNHLLLSKRYSANG
jgi:LacI family transcriptional regulator